MSASIDQIEATVTKRARPRNLVALAIVALVLSGCLDGDVGTEKEGEEQIIVDFNNYVKMVIARALGNDTKEDEIKRLQSNLWAFVEKRWKQSEDAFQNAVKDIMEKLNGLETGLKDLGKWTRQVSAQIENLFGQGSQRVGNVSNQIDAGSIREGDGIEPGLYLLEEAVLGEYIRNIAVEPRGYGTASQFLRKRFHGDRPLSLRDIENLCITKSLNEGVMLRWTHLDKCR